MLVSASTRRAYIPGEPSTGRGVDSATHSKNKYHIDKSCLIDSSQKYLTKTKVITSAFKRSPSHVSTGMNYSTSAGSRWKRAATVSAASCTTSRQRLQCRQPDQRSPAPRRWSGRGFGVGASNHGHGQHHYHRPWASSLSAVVAQAPPQLPGIGLPLTLNTVAATGNSSAGGNLVL
jgi:hypothetical protein